MSTVHQKFQADLDTKAYEAGLHRMENATKTSTARSAREFSKIDQSMSRQAASMGGGKGSMRAGQIAMQMQDIGVQMQQGARASTIIAQQGSQILSVFGPQGMLLGGLVAAGAMFWEVVRGAKALNKEAKEQKALARQNKETAAAKAGLEQMRADEKATKIAEARLTLKEEEVKALERELDLKERILKIEESEATALNKAVFIESARKRSAAEGAVEFKQFTRNTREAIVQEGGDIINARASQIMGDAPSKAEVRRQERETNRARRRAINEQIDEEDRERRNERPKDAHRGKGDRMSSNERQLGLTEEEKAERRKDRTEAAKAANDKKIMAAFDDEQLRKITNSIEKLIAK